jgi:hypothetical protein
VLKDQAGKILPLLARSAVGEGLKGVRSLGKVAIKTTGEVTAVFKDSLEKVPLLGEVGKTLEKAARELTSETGDAVEKAAGALEGLLGGKKEKPGEKKKKDGDQN